MVKLKNFFYILFIFILFGNTLVAQVDSVYAGEGIVKKGKDKKPKDRSEFWDKVFYGGNFNALFGTYTIVSLNPVIGYRISDKFHVGGGGIFNYYAVRYSGYTVSQVFYGSHTFARYFITDNIFAQGQYDRLYQPKINYAKGTLEKGWVDYVLVGGGIRQPIGEHAFFVASLMYNINADPKQISAYYNPVVQVGIIGGF